MSATDYVSIFPPTGSQRWPIVISSPHGGSLMPEELPDRTEGCMEPDDFSLELARELRESFLALQAATPSAPALVALQLDRRKLDANRARTPAGPQPAWAVWDKYHGGIAAALQACVEEFGVALLLDVHGQSHRDATEIGYLLTSQDLLVADDELESKPPRPSSLDALALNPAVRGPSLGDAVRGPHSLGSHLERAGFGCTPSDVRPQPVPRNTAGPTTYFWGAYTTRRYGAPSTVPSQANPLTADTWPGFGRVAVAQLEVEMRARRDPATRAAFAVALRDAALGFLAAFSEAPRPKPLL